MHNNDVIHQDTYWDTNHNFLLEGGFWAWSNMDSYNFMEAKGDHSWLLSIPQNYITFAIDNLLTSWVN